MNEIEKRLHEILRDVDVRGYLRSRESNKLEYKENFNFRNLGSYLRTIAAFANNQGGTILYGVKDSPHIPIGINRDKFDGIRIERISTFLSDYFSPQISWSIGLVKVNGRYFGYLNIDKCRDKPIICKKNSGKELKNGEIYYRYRGHVDGRDKLGQKWSFKNGPPG